MPSSPIDITALSRGDVVSAVPPETNDSQMPITRTSKGRLPRHPIIVFSIDKVTKTVKGLMCQSFGNSTSITQTGLESGLYKWFLPVGPAQKESIHSPVPTRPGSAGKPEWVNLRDLLTIVEDRIVGSLVLSFDS